VNRAPVLPRSKGRPSVPAQSPQNVFLGHARLFLALLEADLEHVHCGQVGVDVVPPRPGRSVVVAVLLVLLVELMATVATNSLTWHEIIQVS
jgi:hypothetical protein